MSVDVAQYLSKLASFENLVELAQLIRKDGPVYIDNHCNQEKQINKINVCMSIFKDKLEKVWICPGGYDCSQCKNPLFVSNNKVHLTMSSKGIILSSENQLHLRSDKPLIQKCRDETEITVQMSIESFLKQVLGK
jgi:hypothetical protein